MDKPKITVAAIALFVAVVLVGLFVADDDDYVIAENPWQRTTVSYESNCDSECQKNVLPLAAISNRHLKGVVLLSRPDINDAYAQLGDCMESIMACIDKDGNPNAAPKCVAESKCPVPCKTAFAGLSENIRDNDKMLDLIETVFITGENYCSPRRWEGVK